MIVVDSHCHVSRSWFEPVESLLFQMDQNEVAHAVLVQMMGQFDNTYQLECQRRYPGRFASVVLVDVERPDAAVALERLAEHGASGARLRPSHRSPGDDPLAIWRAAERLGLAVSCPGGLAEYLSPAFAEVIEAVPGLPIVIEHLGAGNQPSQDPAAVEGRRRVFQLARFPNVFIKIHGLGEFCRRAIPVSEPFPFERPIPPFLDEALGSFGPARMMWGSDYPPVSDREGYANALRLTMDQLATRGEEDRRLVFGEVALRLFPVRT